MIVVDTSVAIKWLRSVEEGHESAMTIYKNHIENIEKITVPSLFYIEAANALATNSVLSEKDVSEGIDFLFESRLIEQVITQKIIIEAAMLAKKYQVSVYDMLYAVIAKEKKTVLITADKKFVRKVNLPFVQTLSELVLP